MRKKVGTNLLRNQINSIKDRQRLKEKGGGSVLVHVLRSKQSALGCYRNLVLASDDIIGLTTLLACET